MLGKHFPLSSVPSPLSTFQFGIYISAQAGLERTLQPQTMSDLLFSYINTGPTVCHIGEGYDDPLSVAITKCMR